MGDVRGCLCLPRSVSTQRASQWHTIRPCVSHKALFVVHGWLAKLTLPLKMTGGTLVRWGRRQKQAPPRRRGLSMALRISYAAGAGVAPRVLFHLHAGGLAPPSRFPNWAAVPAAGKAASPRSLCRSDGRQVKGSRFQ